MKIKSKILRDFIKEIQYKNRGSLGTSDCVKSLKIGRSVHLDF